MSEKDPPGEMVFEHDSAIDAMMQTSKRRWLRGRAPLNFTEMLHEIDVREEELQRKVAAAAPKFLLGHPPAGADEVEAEVRLRTVQREWDVEAADRQRRADNDFNLAKLDQRAARVRAWTLVLVVGALIAAPLLAIAHGIPAADFGQYMAPITGIAGAIVGYWFARGTDTRSDHEAK